MLTSFQIVVGVTKAVSERFGKGGIADRMIWFNGFPFLDNKEEHTFGVPVSHAMTTDPVTLPATGYPVKSAEELLKQKQYQGFPIVENHESKILLGYIGSTELQYGIDRARREGMVAPNATCVFASSSTDSEPDSASTPAVTFDGITARTADFSIYVDKTPLTVHPRLPLETVMELFKKMGPRVILVEHRGQVNGLVTVKDCLKYQFTVEAQENSRVGEGEVTAGGGERWLWETMQKVGDHISDWVLALSGGRVRLSPAMTSSRRFGRGRRDDSLAESNAEYVVGDEDDDHDWIREHTEDDEGTELTNR